MKQKNHKALAGLVALAAVFAATQAHAAPPYFQGFEDPLFAPNTEPGDFDNFGYDGTIERVLSNQGKAGVASKSGDAHGQINYIDTNAGHDVSVTTRFGGFSSSFGDGFKTSVDIFLDTAWASETGFDFSSAASKQDGKHLRDFIWHVGMDGTNLKVNASNGTNYNFNADRLTPNNGPVPFTVTNSGWYTFENVFRDDGGALAVDFNLRKDDGSLLTTFTRSNPSDLINSIVGGNRYGWFTFNNIDGLAIDNVSAVPEPGVYLGMAFALGLFGYRRFKARAKSDAAA